MPRQPEVHIQNNFLGGLKTEATALNFPENACTSTSNCVFDIVGSVERRQGFDLETGHVNLNGVLSAQSAKAISSYLWRNVNGDGNVTLFMTQVGNSISAYRVTTGTAISSGSLGQILSLTTVAIAGAPDPGTIECQFSDGDGFLFLVNPYITPTAIAYDPVANSFTPSPININIRDFDGVPEPGVPVSQRPSSLTWQHRYNLLNQGWSEFPFGDAAGALSTQFFNGGNSGAISLSTFPYPAPVNTAIIAAIAPTVLAGVATATTAQTIISNYDNTFFSTMALLPNSLYPSNSDVWTNYRDSFGAFNPTIAQLSLLNSGSTRAPNGHFILDAFNQDRRVSVAGSSGAALSTIPIPVFSSGIQRPSVNAFYAGRCWYSGVNAPGFAQNIYFSQVISGDATPQAKFGLCYQQQDPTAQDLFDLLPTDGGVIKIPQAGTIYKLFPLQGALVVFASNGIWAISGSQGLGFSASDYSVSKISSIKTVSGSSFVDVLGFPMWWAIEGIYTMVVDPSHGGFRIDSLSDTTIYSFYHSIPQASIPFVRGYYNPSTFTVQWIYSSSAPTTIQQSYSYNSVLNLNRITGAFYPWSISGTPNSAVSIHGIACFDSSTIVDPDGTTSIGHGFKYITSYITAGNIFFSFSEVNSNTYKDWASLVDGFIDYTSSFTTGFGIHAQAFRKFQPTYLYVFVDNTLDSAYNIQAIWDFANAQHSNKFTTKERINNGAGTGFGTVYNRIKIRGNGLAIQINVTSVPGLPFTMIGWVVPETQDTGV